MISRRKFSFQLTSSVFFVRPGVLFLISCTSKKKDRGLNPVDPDEGEAKILNYTHHAFKEDEVPTKPIPRDLTERTIQICKNCRYFVPVSLENRSDLDGKWGECQILGDGHVSASGRCDSWRQKD